jgi:hypothetical protein
MGRKYATKRRNWWTLLFPGGVLDIDYDDELHLYESRAHAEMEVRGGSLDAVPVQIELKIKRGPFKAKPF